MKGKKLIVTLAALLSSLGMNAQFFSLGDDPGFLKWSCFDTPSYRIIYPSGIDSLAIDFAGELEKNKILIGKSLATFPNEARKRPLPVVLHPYNPISNGSVAWAPRRMDLFTVMESSNPLGLPSQTQLILHESRHAAQMESFNRSWMKPFNYIVGEIASGAFCALYGGRSLMEGDAVVAETALTSSGRGRSYDFLEYFMVAFDEGDYRNYYKWRYSEQNKYSPDFYRVAYMSNAGVRTLYNEPLFTKNYYSNLAFSSVKKSIEEVSGKKAAMAFREIEESFASEWDSLRTLRALGSGEDFLEGNTVSASSRLFREYRSLCFAAGRLFAIRSGLDIPSEVVEVLPEGRTRHLCYCNSSCSNIQWSETLKTLIFSSVVPDLRWDLSGTSRVCSIDPDSGKITYLTKEGRLFNPSPSPLDDRISVTSYPIEGGSAVLILDSRDGKVLISYDAPQGTYVTETAWDGNVLYAAAVIEGGFAFFNVSEGWKKVLGPESLQVKQLRSTDGKGILFVSDMNGVNELYRFRKGSLMKLSNTRNGASDFALSPRGELFYSELSTGGRAIKKAPCPKERPAIYERSWTSPIAEKLSAQENSLLTPLNSRAWDGLAEIKPYNKATHLFRFHSWIPMFADIDDVSSLSFESVEESAAPGAMAFFQNSLSTAQGYIGYSLNKQNSFWVNGGHLNFTYSGLFPVISAKLDFYDYGKSIVRTREYEKKSRTTFGGTRYIYNNCDLNGKLEAYVPLCLSSKGWNCGIIPSLSYNFSNSFYDINPARYRERSFFGNEKHYYEFLSYEGENLRIYSRIKASVRGYRTLPISTGSIYPKWGIGGEGGYIANPGLNSFYSPSFYLKVYGYVPGILPTHGVRMSLLSEKLTQKDAHFLSGNVDCLPRGFGNYDYSYTISNQYTSHTLLSMDYAFPFLPVGWAPLGGFFYINNFELRPHFDLTLMSGKGKGTLTSTGATFLVKFEDIFWLTFESKIGLSFSYNGGSLLEDILYCEDKPAKRYYIGLSMSMTI